MYRPTQLQESSPTRRRARGHALLSGEADTIARVKVRELRAVFAPFYYWRFFLAEGWARTYMFCFNFLQSREELHNIMKYCRVILIRGIDGVYRLIEKIKRREENCYVAPYGRGKLREKRFSLNFFFSDIWHKTKRWKVEKFFNWFFALLIPN